MRRWYRRGALLLVALAWGLTAWWHATKPLPAGLHLASAPCATQPDELAFVPDVTAADAWGRRVVSQGIFDAVLTVVRQARRFIVLDYALIGAEPDGSPQRRLAVELTDALLAQRRQYPDLKVLFITDPVNEDYGARAAPELELLRAHGVDVVPVQLDALRDSNLLWSSLWRLTLSWWDGPGAPFGSTARRLNGKRDHRKLILADDGAGALTAVIGSANPRDDESAWSNVALRVHGAALAALRDSELAVARFSGWHGSAADYASGSAACAVAVPAGAAAVQVLTEGAVREELLRHIGASVRGDAIEMALHYLSEQQVADALLAAARRGVAVRLILDPNQQDGGAGIPNQPQAAELVARSGGLVRVRWYRTHGERFHDSMTLVYGGERLWLTLGSANLTRRSLDDYNLEANVALSSERSGALAQQALGYFDALWLNHAALGIEYSADFAVYSNPAQLDYWLGRLLEGLGLSSF